MMRFIAQITGRAYCGDFQLLGGDHIRPNHKRQNEIFPNKNLDTTSQFLDILSHFQKPTQITRRFIHWLIRLKIASELP